MSAKELVKKLENARPKCRVCHEEIARGKPMCYACDQGYEACRADAVAWLRSHSQPLEMYLADEVDAGKCDGFAKEGA